MNNAQYSAALNELKNNALLLAVANNHLTDDVFLINRGNTISHVLEAIKQNISSLKKDYPGKFFDVIDTDKILEKIDNRARQMMNPGKEIRDQYASGELGREMETYVRTITEAVEDIRLKVYGSPVEIDEEGAVKSFINSLKNIAPAIVRILSVGAKFLAYLIVLLGILFSYLYFTIEKDEPLLTEIATCQTLIKEKQKLISKSEQEKQDFDKQRTAMKSVDKMSRQEKVEALDLEMKIKKLENTIDQTSAELSVQEKKLANYQAELNVFRKKSFITKLLKR